MSPARRPRPAALGLVLAGLAALLVVPTGSATSRRSPVPGPPGPSTAWTARLVAPVKALSAPVTGRLVDRQSAFGGWSGGQVSLLVLGARTGSDGELWLRVLLPVRPNGTSGWIPADAVELGTTGWRIEISTERRTVEVFDHGTRLRTWGAVVGAPLTPTPHGLFAVYERVPLADPDGFFGP